MSDEIRLPKDRRNLTGHRSNAPEEVIEKEIKLIKREQQKTIRDFPKESNMVRSLIASIDLAGIQAMYEDINLRSAGPLKEDLENQDADENTLTYAKAKVHTNSITPKDIYLVSPRRGQPRGMTALYDARLNMVRLNLGSTQIQRLVHSMELPRPLTEKNARYVLDDVYTFYHLLFHELGHAYAFTYQSLHRSANGEQYLVARSGVGEKRIHDTPIPDTDQKEIREYTDMEFWMEGFNELQTFFRLREYLQNHSLGLDDFKLPTDSEDLWRLFMRHCTESSYGAATIAVDRVVEYVCEIADVPYSVAFDAFTKIFQTIGGQAELIDQLEKLLGPKLTAQIRDVSTHKLNETDKLGHDILVHLKTDPYFLEFVEEFITHPNRKN